MASSANSTTCQTDGCTSTLSSMEDHLPQSSGSLFQDMVHLTTIHGYNLTGLFPNSEHPFTDAADPFRHGFVPTTRASNGTMEGHHSVYNHISCSGAYQPVQQLDMTVHAQMTQYDATRSHHALQQFPFTTQTPPTNNGSLMGHQGTSNRDQSR
ncbi:hypothetical protein ASPCADRAFT_206047 [Aspergillus carbonarius ITEM 5010]|uniref:Uncharacterized protein n=1 Tax=Aspergillus carbonarius (strain ITEM 5010) TaxID=602072 RepID=A0A1R3RRY9_ASPC5|nr:hypothetical protein ASPCADRAFT_206047 [Aspergillus carbonarius ITEM 5010]